MSYSIENYAMRAVSIPDFIDSLKSGISVPINKSGIYVILDDKFRKLCELHMPQSFRESECGSAELIEENGFRETTSFSFKGPSCAFTAVIASACGLSDSSFYSSPDGYIARLPVNMKGDMQIFPSNMIAISLNGKQIKGALVYCPEHSVLHCLVCFLSSQNLLSVVSRDDTKFSLIPCLKTSLKLLLKSHHYSLGKDNNTIYAYEYWMRFLIDAFLESRECYQTIEVLSSNFGSVIDYGGMRENVPYISIGSISSYDENGWDDPADSEPEVVSKIRTALFGKKSKIEFEKFTPQFGG